ncbi:MAG: hypothetical protein PHU40_09915 [Sulfurimonas sp.]|nr:hypothetical protein [Sulfurimonas sp.]
MTKISIAISVAALLMYGCSDAPKEQENNVTTEKTQSSTEQAVVSTPQNIYGASSAETEVPKAAPTDTDMQLNTPHSAAVLETMNSGGYTYVKVDEAGSVYWIAGPQSDVTVGTTISFIEQMVMTDFSSKSLNKTFEQLVFVSAIVSADKSSQNSAPTSTQAMDDAHKNCDHDQEIVDQTAPQPVQVSKNADGYSIEELYAKKADLNAKSIKVNATVVKVSKNIMGKDWIHLQDGTGIAESSDIIATSTNSTVKVGDIVITSGVIKTDVDLGYGYQFSIIIEEAKFTSL